MRQKRPRLMRTVRVGSRRLVRRFDRRASALLPWIPSWGGSLMLHACILLLLSLYLYVSSGKGDRKDDGIVGQLTEDINSLVDSDHAGDPFTSIKAEEAPSLSLKKAEPDAKDLSQPEVPNLSRFAPEVTIPESVAHESFKPEPDTKKSLARRTSKSASRLPLSTSIATLHVEDLTAPFSGRSEDMKAKLLRREGGTVKSERAVQAGLDWLARHQRPDGSWSLHYQAQCRGDGCPAEDPVESDSAATGLALLPMLGAGHIHTVKTRYQAAVRGGLEWLVSHQDVGSGDLYVGQPGMPHMYSHAIAAMALCEAYGLSKDPKLRGPAQAAIDFIVNSQDVNSGGWRYAPGQSGDTSVFGWNMFALRSAKLGGLRIPKTVTNGCRSYLDSASADDKRITYAYLPGRGATPVMTAEALLSRQYLGWPKEYPPLVKGAGMVASHLDESTDRNIYYWYYATQLLHNMQNDDWKRWNLKVREGLIAMQVQSEGCAQGSWDPQSPSPDRWGSSGGRLFVTALSTLTLEVYYRYLPLYRTTDKDDDKLDTEADVVKKAAAIAPAAEPR